MTLSTRRYLAILALTCAALAPVRSLAQAVPKLDSLASQEREMLALATDLSKKCAATLERWITNKEITEEKLFSFLYYPILNTDPLKYATDYDRFSDRDILAIEEAVLAKAPMILFTVLVDKNGYLPTHNTKYSQPLTGNRAVDLVNNRTKMMFIDRTGIAAARSQAPFLFQRYARDTGEVLIDLSVPVFVRGTHWGAVRIGYRQIDPS
jgi:methyl-accepting chemotaxis protein